MSPPAAAVPPVFVTLGGVPSSCLYNRYLAEDVDIVSRCLSSHQDIYLPSMIKDVGVEKASWNEALFLVCVSLV